MPANPSPRLAYVVSHTHWDREWYLTYHRFRTILVRVVKGVLDALENDPDFLHFCLDGQAVVLEDHLEVCPEDGERIRRLVDEGALSVGPWYVLPDEFLIGAEATVRNLVYGHQVAGRFGPVSKVGYMPDSFGHVAQVPQILRGAGIDSFIYTRGNGDEIDELGWEYLWEAPDGSEVLAVNQCGGYCNAAGLGLEEIWHAHTAREVVAGRAVTKVRELFEKMAERSNGDVWLLNNGCDHFPVQREFGAVLGALREAFPATEFRHAGFREFVDAVRGVATKRYRGELLGGKLHHILSGVWSARMPLKQANEEAHTLLSACWEPLAAYARFVHGAAYPAGLIESAWKLLLKNQPHDSICGCSIDEVHREMEPRFAGAIETADHSIAAALQSFAPTFGRTEENDRDTVLCVFNPLPEGREVVVERLVVLQPLGHDLDQLRLIDESGGAVAFEVVEARFLARFWGVDYRMEPFSDRQRSRLDSYGDVLRASTREKGDAFLWIRFFAQLPACGHALFRLVDDGGSVVAAGGVEVSERELENALVAVRLHPNGTFDLTDKRSGIVLEGLNLLEDTEDIGDEYDYSPAERSSTVTSADASGTVRVVDGGGLRGCLEASFALRLPLRIESDRKRRSVETVDCPVLVRVSLEVASPVVDVELRFDNRAEDHRLRALFPCPGDASTLKSDGHFLVNERPVEMPSGEGWVQPPPETLPQQEYSMFGDLALLNRGLPEIAADKHGLLKLTLLRCVGWLSRDDFPTRRCQNAGPTIPTPDAQCLAEQRFRYAVVPLPHDVQRANRRWRTPVPVVQGVADGSVPGGSLLECDGPVRVTAIKRHEERDTLVVRVFNPTSEEAAFEPRFALPIQRAWHTNLLEERAGEATFPATLRPHQIATFEFEL